MGSIMLSGFAVAVVATVKAVKTVTTILRAVNAGEDPHVTRTGATRTITMLRPIRDLFAHSNQVF